MRSARRDIVEPIAIIGTSLISNPVARDSDARYAGFSRVFADAMKESRSRKHRGYGYAHLAQGYPGAHTEDPPVSPPSLLNHAQTIDLYARLDMLLREKSVLIAVV